MIRSFGDKMTESLFHGHETKETRKLPRDLVRAALRKFDMLNAATSLNDLRVPPGNRLEALKGDLEGTFSIRVDIRWRVVFRWERDSAWDVQLMDYHGKEEEPCCRRKESPPTRAKSFLRSSLSPLE